MRKKYLILVVILVLLLLPHLLFADGDIRIAVLDFIVQSESPDLKYVGKGLAEFVAVELSKSQYISIIQRESRNAILQEQEFSLSDLADPTTSVKVGRMLAANYLLIGNLYDFAGGLNIIFQLVSVETAEVVYQDRIDAQLDRYDYITATIAQTVLDSIDKEVPSDTSAKAALSEVKNQEVIIAFSKAVDAYDKRDATTAKKELSRAATLDTKNEAIQSYLDKLVADTTRFKTIVEHYSPSQNPALLGIVKEDALFWSLAISGYGGDLPQDLWGQIEGYNLGVWESEIPGWLGYRTPLGDRWGLGVEMIYSQYHKTAKNFDKKDWATGPDAVAIGPGINLGYALSHRVAVGAGVSVLYSTRNDYEQTFWTPAFSAGMMIRNFSSSFLYDFVLGYSMEKIWTVDAVAWYLEEAQDPVTPAPLYWENTLTYVLDRKRTYLVAKEVNLLEFENGVHFFRLLPGIEHWIADWLSLRISLEGSLMLAKESVTLGGGAATGFTIKLPKSGWYFDVNIAVNRRPIFCAPGSTIWTLPPALQASITKSPLIRARQRR